MQDGINRAKTGSAIIGYVSIKTIEAERKAMELHRAIADNGFTNRAVVYYQMSMAGCRVPGGLAT